MRVRSDIGTSDYREFARMLPLEAGLQKKAETTVLMLEKMQESK